jgi:hypothetical protein
LADELYDKRHVVVDGIDGKAHSVALPAKTQLAQYLVGAVVEARGSADVCTDEKNIAVLAADSFYPTDHHRAIIQAPAHSRATTERHLREVVDAHVRRLEALCRAGIAGRVAEGIWRVPDDSPVRGRRYDAQRLGGVAVELRSQLPIERQAGVIGATWLDQQSIVGRQGVGRAGTWERRAYRASAALGFPDQGFAERHGQRVFLRNLLATLRRRELATATQTIAAETELKH